MGSRDVLVTFASLLEKHLRPVEDVHGLLRGAGFEAWHTFVDERLKLLDEARRPAELRTLLLSCREEFCSFARYTRDAGGDGLRLAELERIRQENACSTTGCLLESDARLRADLSLAVTHARAMKQRVSAQLTVERSRYTATARTMAESARSSISDIVRAVLEKRFAAAGFTPFPARVGSACFRKDLGSLAKAYVGMDRLDRVGDAGWNGNVPLSFYLRVDGALARGSQNTCCKGVGALPLRIDGLVPGIGSYRDGTYLLPSSIQTVGDRDVVTLTVYEAPPSTTEDLAIVLGQIEMAVDCYLTTFQAVEGALVSASAEFQSGAWSEE
jgi:hypothetical protein